MWLVIGFVIGALAAWWYVKRQHEEQIDTLNDRLSRVEAELAEERRAREAIKGQLSDMTSATSLAPTADAESPATAAPVCTTSCRSTTPPTGATPGRPPCPMHAAPGT